MKTNIQNVRGTQDFFNEQIDRFNYVVNVFKKNVGTYNFHEIITPIIEFSNLFERSVGDDSDIIMKELYKFEDRGGNLLALDINDVKVQDVSDIVTLTPSLIFFFETALLSLFFTTL